MKTKRANKDEKQLIEACSKYKESLSEKLLAIEIPRRNIDQGYGLDARHSFYALGEESSAFDALIKYRGGEQNIPLVAQKYKAISIIQRSLINSENPIQTFIELFKKYETTLTKKTHDNDMVFLAIVQPMMAKPQSKQQSKPTKPKTTLKTTARSHSTARLFKPSNTTRTKKTVASTQKRGVKKRV